MYGDGYAIVRRIRVNEWQETNYSQFNSNEERASKKLIARRYVYADKRNLTGIVDAIVPEDSETYTYTPNGFLQSALGPWSSPPAATTDVYAYTSGSNRLASITTNATLSRSFGSDASGNITADTTVSPAQTKNFTYNAEGQLATSLLRPTARGTYTYDHLSRLVSRTDQTAATAPEVGTVCNWSAEVSPLTRTPCPLPSSGNR